MLAVRVFETFSVVVIAQPHRRWRPQWWARARYTFCAQILLVFYATRRLSSIQSRVWMCSSSEVLCVWCVSNANRSHRWIVLRKGTRYAWATDTFLLHRFTQDCDYYFILFFKNFIVIPLYTYICRLFVGIALWGSFIF